MEKVTYGMVGGDLKAFIGDVHRKAIGFDTRAELVCGCFSRKRDLNAECARAYNIEPSCVYPDYRQMLEAESKKERPVDFISVCTPNSTHYDIAKQCLIKGFNVVCEKPLCFEVGQAEELERLANEKGLIFAVAYSYTGNVMVKVMREMIREGKIGDIIAVNATYIQDWLLGELSKDETENVAIWRTNPELSGVSSTVGDIGTHIENIVHYVAGLDIKRLCATVNRFGKKLEYNANMLVEYTNGVNGSYWCSQVACGQLNDLSVSVYGKKGSLKWEHRAPDFLWYTQKDGPQQLLARGAKYLTEEAASLARIPCGHPEGVYEAFANLYQNIINAIIKKRNGEKLTEKDLDFPTVSDGLNGVKFIRAAIKSADNGSAWVDL